jgi:hypothetical protein
LADRCHTSTNRKLTSNERGATRRTACLRVVVGEQHTFSRKFIQIGRSPGHHPAVICIYIPNADIVAHNYDDVWLFCLGLNGNGKQ